MLDATDDDGPIPGCNCEDCDDEVDFAAWTAELVHAEDQADA